MIIEVYKGRSNKAILYSDEFSVECRLPNLFMSNRYRSAQSDYLHNLFVTFKPARTTFKITPYFFIEMGDSDTLNSSDLGLKDFYNDLIVSTWFDILDIKFIQSNTLPDYKSTLCLIKKICTIEVSQKEFKKFILRITNNILNKYFFYLAGENAFKEICIFKTWLYSYFPGIRIHYVENELMKLLKRYITKYDSRGLFKESR